MFGIKRKAALFERLGAIHLGHIQREVESGIDDKTLTKVIAFLSMICAGSFLTNTCPRMSSVTRALNRDVLAFEALAFSLYAVREAYSPMSAEIAQDMEEDDTDQKRRALSDAFRDAASVCAGIVERDTGWNTDAILSNRLMAYHNAPSIAGQEGSAERFRFLLMSIGKAKAPQPKYGKVSLDLRATMESMGAVQAFANMMPKGCADTLRGISREFGLL